ncbi:MAG: esterase [Lachnospiraceae bacterium]|nr:esterase [Lachnospiraceae bacterium]
MEKYVYGDPNAKLCLIQMVDDHDLEGMESEVHEIRKRTEADFCLIALKVSDWNSDLSPWPSPAVFKNEDFGGKAPETLKEVLKLCQDPEKTYIIGGYSIAGLFSLWAVYQTHVFQSAAAASPSVWFPGFIDYMKNHKLMADSVYLSLGDKEEKARNPVLASVGVKIKEAYDLLSQEGIQTILEWNPGNHFRDSDIRTAKAFAWAILT